jgi:acyl carrier protein
MSATMEDAVDDSDRLRDEIRAVIADIGELDDPAAIGPEDHLIDDLELDSMLLLELLASLEQAYGITIPEREFPTMTTVDRCVAVVRRYRGDAG